MKLLKFTFQDLYSILKLLRVVDIYIFASFQLRRTNKDRLISLLFWFVIFQQPFNSFCSYNSRYSYLLQFEPSFQSSISVMEGATNWDPANRKTTGKLKQIFAKQSFSTNK